MKLIRIKTGEEIKRGDVFEDFRGAPATVLGWSEPKHAGSTGRVQIQQEGEPRECFPGVIGAKFVD